MNNAPKATNRSKRVWLATDTFLVLAFCVLFGPAWVQVAFDRWPMLLQITPELILFGVPTLIFLSVINFFTRSK